MSMPHLLRSMLLREGMIELDQHIQRTRGYGPAEGWEPGLELSHRDSSSDYDAERHDRIRAAREGQRGTAEHWLAQRETQREHKRNGNR